MASERAAVSKRAGSGKGGPVGEPCHFGGGGFRCILSNPRGERDPATLRRGLAVTDHHRRR
jgi:hypothetical protein